MNRVIAVEANDVFRPVHLSKCRYVVMKGSAGSGKSLDTAQMYIIRLMQDIGRNLLCVRKSDVSNRDSTFSELLSAVNRLGVQKEWNVAASPLMLTCSNGNRIIFRGVNDDTQREKLKSITFEKGKLTDVWIEEATEISREDFEIIDDRLRGELDEGLFYQIKLTLNPVSANHWIKRIFFDCKDENVLTHHSTYLDNKFIDQAYKERMERRRILDPEGYKVYGLGEWGESSGLILKNFVVEGVSQDLELYDCIRIGQDFGFNHSNAILTVGFKDSDVYVLNELYIRGKDTGEIIRMAEEKGISKSAIMYCDCAEPDRIKTWTKAGFKAMPVRKGAGSVLAHIDWLKQRRIFINSSCVNTINEIRSWRWQEDRASGLYIDEPVAQNDDAMAALRYAVHDLIGERKARVHDRRVLYNI